MGEEGGVLFQAARRQSWPRGAVWKRRMRDRRARQVFRIRVSVLYRGRRWAWPVAGWLFSWACAVHYVVVAGKQARAVEQTHRSGVRARARDCAGTGTFA